MRTIVIVLLLIAGSLKIFAQNTTNVVTTNKKNEQLKYKYAFYTTWLSLFNFGKPETNTHHYEIHFGYQLTGRDRIGIKAATWKLFAPMGIPIWDDQFLDKNSFYPGRLKETGIGITYQRKLWKGLFASIEVLPLITEYIDKEVHVISKGFKFYNSYHLGYQISLFKNKRFFIEPQLHINHWTINTNVPDTFAAEEKKWNNYFLIEPNLYFGIKF